MSTRCQVKIIGDFDEEIWFYRHSDGYPEGALPTLQKFMDWVKAGRIRTDAEQASGWLVLLGAQEYGEHSHYMNGSWVNRPKTLEEILEPGKKDDISGCKCGAYEPCTPVRHGDIEYFYTLDLRNGSIQIEDLHSGKKNYAKGYKPKPKKVE